MSIETQRNETRKRIKKLRSGQTELDRGSKSVAIGKRLGSLHGFQTARAIAFFSSTQGEVNTDEMIDSSLREGKKISMPKVNTKSVGITFYQIHGRKDMKVGKYGILEPDGDHRSIVTRPELDIMIVPGIAFDGNCNRLGYGKGYYDSFLREIGAMKVGLAFDFQIVPKIDRVEGDVQMDFVITESRLLRRDVEKVGKDLIFE